MAKGQREFTILKLLPVLTAVKIECFERDSVDVINKHLYPSYLSVQCASAYNNCCRVVLGPKYVRSVLLKY